MLPVAFIYSSIFPSVYSVSGDFVFLPVAFELASVGPLVDAVTVLHAILVLPRVLGAIDPRFFSLPLPVKMELAVNKHDRRNRNVYRGYGPLVEDSGTQYKELFNIGQSSRL